MSQQTTTRPSVREIFSREGLEGEGAKPGATDEDIAKSLAPITGMPAEMFNLAMKAGEALGKSLHIKSKKQVEKSYTYAYADVVRAVALVLASLNRDLAAIFDTKRGSVIEARLPKDIFSLGGTLRFEIIDNGPSQVRIIGSSEISGQMFDWGKGKRALNEVFDKVEQYLRMMA